MPGSLAPPSTPDDRGLSSGHGSLSCLTPPSMSDAAVQHAAREAVPPKSLLRAEAAIFVPSFGASAAATSVPSSLAPSSLALSSLTSGNTVQEHHSGITPSSAPSLGVTQSLSSSITQSALTSDASLTLPLPISPDGRRQVSGAAPSCSARRERPEEPSIVLSPLTVPHRRQRDAIEVTGGLPKLEALRRAMNSSMSATDGQRSRPASPGDSRVVPPHQHHYAPLEMLAPDYVDCTCSWARSDANWCHYMSDGAIGPGGETVCGNCDGHFLLDGCECDCDGCTITVSPAQRAEHQRLCEEAAAGCSTWPAV